MAYKRIIVDDKEFYLVPIEDIDKPTTKNVAFVVGHHSNSQGDFSSYFNSTEFNYWKRFAETRLIELGDVFIHNSQINSYDKRQIEMAEKTKDYNLVIELHWNSFDPDNDGDDDANGVECFVLKGNDKMLLVGDYFCELMVDEMGLRNRNCKPIDSGNGYGFLNHTYNDAILLEPIFADNFIDIQKFSSIKYFEVIKQLIEFYNEN